MDSRIAPSIGLEGRAVDAGFIQGAVEGIFAAAAVVQNVDGALDGVQSGSQRFASPLRLSIRLHRRACARFIGMRMQVDEGRQREGSNLAIQSQSHADLRVQ